MGLIDSIFRRGKAADVPPKATTPPLDAQGGSGRQHTSGFLDYDEINHALRGRAGIEKFDEMWRTDADARRAITLCVNPMVAGTYEVRPFKADDETDATAQDEEIAQFVWWNLTEAMRPKLMSHLWTALTVGARSGFVAFEDIYTKTQWRGRDVFALKTLHMKRPQSVDRWFQDDKGTELLGIEQFVSGVDFSSVTYNAENLVYYRFGAEGDNWEGQSLLRPAYKHWTYKNGFELIEGIALERGTVGVPTGWAAGGHSDPFLDEFEEFLENVRASDDSFILFPGPKAGSPGTPEGQGYDWEFKVPANTGEALKAIRGAIDGHKAQIGATVVAEFMALGQNGEGARATADIQQDPFWMLMETLVSIIVEDTINEQLIPRLVDFNYTVKPGQYPKLKCALIDSTSLTELGTYVLNLSKAGAFAAEPAIENYLRQKADLPERDEQAIEKQQAEEQAQAQQEAQIAAAAADQAHGHAVEGADQQHGHAVDQIKAKADADIKVAKAKPKPPAPVIAGQPGKPKPGGPATLDAEGWNPRTLARADRALKAHEQVMSLDRIEDEIDQARAAFEASCGAHVRALAVSLSAQAAKGRPVRPANAPAELTAAIAHELHGLYATGRATVQEELNRQRLDGAYGDAVMLAADIPMPGDIARRAQAAANAIRGAIAAALEALGLHRGEASDVATFQQAGETAGAAALRGQALTNAAPALNQGRADEADDHADELAGTYYTSILDANRCSHCATADDDVLRPLDDPIRLARKPPNRDCEGGGRCRCLEAFQLKDEAPASA